MADPGELARQFERDLAERSAGKPIAETRRELETDVQIKDRNIRRARSLTTQMPPQDRPAMTQEATSSEAEDVASIREHLATLGKDTGEQYDFDDASVQDTAAPALTQALFDIARSETQGNIKAKFEEHFPGSDLLIIPQKGQSAKIVYRMQPGDRYRLLPRVSPAALASHLAREDVVGGIAGAAGGAALGTAMGGPVGGIVGGIGGAMAGDAAGQFTRKLIETMRGFGEGYDIDLGQVLLAGGGQALVEGWRVGGPLYREYAAGKLMKLMEGAGFTDNAIQFATKYGVTAPGIGQISKSPIVRTLFNQATQISTAGEQFVVRQSVEARNKLAQMAGEGDPAAEAAYKALSGPEFQATADAGAAAAASTTGFPAVERATGGVAVREGLTEGLAKMEAQYKDTFSKANRLMRAERAPYFDVTNLQKVAAETMEPKAFRAAEGGPIPFGAARPALQELQNDITTMANRARTYTNPNGGTATAVEQMLNLRDRAFKLARAEPGDGPATRLHKAIVETMEQPQGVGAAREVTSKSGRSTSMRERPDVGYRLYFRSLDEQARFEQLSARTATRQGAGDATNEGNLAWGNFAPDRAKQWEDWKQILPADKLQTAKDSIVSELARLEPGEATKKLRSFGNAKTMLDDIVDPKMQSELLALDRRKLGWQKSGLSERAAENLTPYTNATNLAFHDSPAVLDQFLAQASPKQKQGLRIGVFREVLADVGAAPRMGGSVIDPGRLENVIRQIRADPDRFQKFLLPDDMEFLELLNDYVGTTARRGDMATSLKKGEMASQLGSGLRWLLNPPGNAAQMLGLWNADLLATVLTQPNLRAGMLAAVNRMGVNGGRAVPQDVRLIGAITGEALNVMDKIGENRP